jgi:hypothetical protein
MLYPDVVKGNYGDSKMKTLTLALSAMVLSGCVTGPMPGQALSTAQYVYPPPPAVQVGGVVRETHYYDTSNTPVVVETLPARRTIVVVPTGGGGYYPSYGAAAIYPQNWLDSTVSTALNVEMISGSACRVAGMWGNKHCRGYGGYRGSRRGYR